MRIAVIDLGTNTFNLLIADISPDGNFSTLLTDRIPVKLGEGSINSGYISKEPFLRGINAMLHYKESINEFNVESICAVATSAIRSAKNGLDFAKEVYEKTNIKIEIIDGNREAELIYKGIALSTKLDQQPAMVMDIGGGSTEFIICNNTTIFWKSSYLLGAARLLDKFKPEDPITPETKSALENYLTEELKELKSAIEQFKPLKLIGSSGAFDSFVDMIAAKKGMEGMTDAITEYHLDLNEFKEMADITIGSTLSERKLMKGLIPIRVDMIVISYFFAKYIIETFKFSSFIASSYSLKEGVIAEKISLLNKV